MDEPIFRIVRGTPTAAELAALVGVLVPRLRAGAVPAPAPAPPSRWKASALPSRGLRPGPGAWRASAHP